MFTVWLTSWSPVEYGEWGGDVGESVPEESLSVGGVLTGLDDVDAPESEVDHQQEADHLSSWLPPHLTRAGHEPLQRVREKHGLDQGLQDDDNMWHQV